MSILQWTIISQYGGYRLHTGAYNLPNKIAQNPPNAYRHNIGFGTGLLDIPRGYEDAQKYNGTLGHKANHSFDKNVFISYVSLIRRSWNLLNDM